MRLDIEYLLDRHYKAIELLDGINSFKNRIGMRKGSLKGFAGTFPNLKAKYLNEIDTFERCIVRLEERYNKLFT